MVDIRACAGAVLALAAFAAPLEARPAECVATIEGERVVLFFDTRDGAYASFRDRLFTRGEACPAAVVIDHLLPGLTPDERQVFCANHDPATGSHSMPAQGRRDAYGRCVEPSRTCQLVNTTREAAAALVGLGGQPEADGPGGALADGASGAGGTEAPGRAGPQGRTGADRLGAAVSSVAHWSGAVILSGNAGTLTGMLASAGTTVGTALATPAVLAGAAASLVVVGGAVWLCSD